MSDVKVGVGVGVIILRDNKVLLGRRLSRHSEPESWTLPGGKLDAGETFEECGVRETKEETDLDLNIEDLEFVSLSNDRNVLGSSGTSPHFITIGLLTKKSKGEVKVMELDKIIDWEWFPFDALPTPLFFPSEKIIKNYLEKKIYRR